MLMTDLPPFLPFFVGSLLVALTKGWIRSLILLSIPVLGGILLLGVVPGDYWQLDFLGLSLTIFRVDKLSILFGYLFHLGAFISIVFALHAPCVRIVVR